MTEDACSPTSGGEATSGETAAGAGGGGGASAADVLALKEQIQQRVEEIWGIRLEPEPVMVGV